MGETTAQVTIHLSRLGKPERVYREGLIEDNGVHLKTFSVVPDSVTIHLSEKFQKQGCIQTSGFIRFPNIISIMSFLVLSRIKTEPVRV